LKENEAGAGLYVFKAGGGEMVIWGTNGFFNFHSELHEYAHLTFGLGFVSIGSFRQFYMIDARVL
jgi:hypothetical protein